jgi:bleomycin hydrolase
MTQKKTHKMKGGPKSSSTSVLNSTLLKRMTDDFASDSHNQLMQNAVTSVSVKKLAARREVFEGADHSFSVRLDDWAATNQKSSGRCWMFAGLNMVRPYAMSKMKLKDFEYSQNYTLYWDKLERANYFLNAIISTADRDADDRTVNHLLGDPISDGGQWNMLVNVIDKYGLAWV